MNFETGMLTYQSDQICRHKLLRYVNSGLVVKEFAFVAYDSIGSWKT